jgi:2-keto-4-pentenoate hydratase/2-oxohepta-3-ene-1,7-dioic acid hydratase in catechol pathway
LGTPDGVGETTQTYLRSGDVVEASVEGLGVSINSVE